jgi:hypothetical protein
MEFAISRFTLDHRTDEARLGLPSSKTSDGRSDGLHPSVQLPPNNVSLDEEVMDYE